MALYCNVPAVGPRTPESVCAQLGSATKQTIAEIGSARNKRFAIGRLPRLANSPSPARAGNLIVNGETWHGIIHLNDANRRTSGHGCGSPAEASLTATSCCGQLFGITRNVPTAALTRRP